ncbi:MAG: LPS export ABC transporter periplasmic protein LptC [Deltaproteobacteria bacterium]|nr:LPS export ABC transporter periplasmic protein LptC [Deltaproteobacteria bacterium]MBW2681772.1 LPS export ABC transporter periplasmic protein LptC [Deltaproteobacteria bacterium]
MPFLKNHNHKKLKLILLSAIVSALGITLAVFITHRNSLDKKGHVVSNIRNKANISIGKAHQTAIKNGMKEWDLEASSVNYMDDNNQAIFQDLFITFYLKDKSEVYLTANKGILNIDSNDMEIFGNVVVKSATYRLNTENLFYRHNRRIIFSKVPVTVIGDAFELAADSMSLNLNTNKTMFEGKVQGTLREVIKL